MEKKGNILIIIIIVILALVIAIGTGYYFGSGGTEKKSNAVPDQTIVPQTSEPHVNNQEVQPVVNTPTSKNWKVDIINNNSVVKFVPASLTINAGDSVTWTNKDRYAHTPIADDVRFVSRPLNVEGDSYTYTFEKPGTHTYHCKIHPDETGVIIVQ